MRIGYYQATGAGTFLRSKTGAGLAKFRIGWSNIVNYGRQDWIRWMIT
jgi:hypothetical protein